MKKIIFFILIIPTILFSQQRVGKTYSQLIREYRDSSITLNYLDSFPSIKVKLKNGAVFHFFNSEMVCIESKVCIRDTSTVNKTIKDLNSNYRSVIDNKAWVSKVDGNSVVLLVSYEGPISNLGYVFGYQMASEEKRK
jgi:hypothetical protein